MSYEPLLGPGTAIFRAADATIVRLAAERDLLLSIVSDLATTQPLVWDGDTWECGLCALAGKDASGRVIHDLDCLYLRARAFLASRETQ